MEIPEDVRYTRSHEWIRVQDDGGMRIGISDYAQDALGDVVFVDLPEVGRAVAAGEPFVEVESTKSVAEVYAPIAGVIAAVNEALFDAPEIINGDPYGEGWFVVITPEDGATLDETMDAAGYAAYTE